MNRKTINFNFKNDRGFLLSGKLELPKKGEPFCFGIFANCFTCMKDFFAPTRVSRGLAEKGIAMLRFDFTGLGQSEGVFADSNFSTNVADIVAASNALKKEFGQHAQIIIGHSFGGTTALGATKFLPELKAIATIGSPKDPDHILRHFQEHQQITEKEDAINLTVAGREYTLKKQFFENMAQHNIAQDTHDFTGGVFIFQAPEDNMVAPENAKEIYNRATEPKFLHMIKGANHMLENPEHTEFVANTLNTWLRKPSQHMT